MKKIIRHVSKHPLSILLFLVPLAALAEVGEWGPVWVFSLSALGVIPLAGYIGIATEALADRSGPRLGGLLNATLGNAAELIITLTAIRAGLLDLVKASITGSILGNLLLVMGMAMLMGGLRHGTQSFDRRSAGRDSILLVLAVLILLIPSMLSHYIGQVEPLPSIRVEALSLGVACVMIMLYAMGMIYSFRTAGNPLAPETAKIPEQYKGWSLKASLIVLALSTAGVVILSELLVGAVEPVVTGLGISEYFIGLIFIPIIGNVAEHLVAVQVALRNRMTLSVEIALSSSLQIALFVAPLLVFLSLLLGHSLTLVFNQFELLALTAGVLVAALVAADGESNWLEGSELLAVYLVLALAFFLMG